MTDTDAYGPSGTIVPAHDIERRARPGIYLVAAVLLGVLMLGFIFAPRARAAETGTRYALARCDLGKPCIWTARFGNSQDCMDEIVRVTSKVPAGTVLQCSVVRREAGR